jgi:hypothetical protein
VCLTSLTRVTQEGSSITRWEPALGRPHNSSLRIRTRPAGRFPDSSNG